jgi:hypothetical protein
MIPLELLAMPLSILGVFLVDYILEEKIGVGLGLVLFLGAIGFLLVCISVGRRLVGADSQ